MCSINVFAALVRFEHGRGRQHLLDITGNTRISYSLFPGQPYRDKYELQHERRGSVGLFGVLYAVSILSLSSGADAAGEGQQQRPHCLWSGADSHRSSDP